jgi:hypothetical protein
MLEGVPATQSSVRIPIGYHQRLADTQIRLVTTEGKPATIRQTLAEFFVP